MFLAFEQLKIAVAAAYRSRYPEADADMSAWRGKEIARFREDLAERVGAQISEKSFYTYFKQGALDKLPRADVLDLLSQYTGSADWAEFSAAWMPTLEISMSAEAGQAPETAPATLAQRKPRRPNWKRLAAATVFVLLLAGGQWLWAALHKQTFIDCKFCLVNADSHEALRGPNIAVHQLYADQSPRLLLADSLTGCFVLQAEAAETLNFVIEAPYHHRQKVSRKPSGRPNAEIIALRTDDYALMLHYFSTADLAGWEARRLQLDGMLAEELQAVQIQPESGQGVAIYNKKEFIDKLTTPIRGLKNIEILETRYDAAGRTTYIRFR